MKFFALLATGLLACVHFPPSKTLVSLAPPADALLFHDVAVFTATGSELLPHQDVLVRGERIISIAPTQPLVPGKALVFEGAGKTLMPGLVDVHTHPTGSGAPFYRLEVPDVKRNLQAELYSGVTTIDVAGGNPQELLELSRQIESGELLGPRMIYAGRIVTQRDGYPPVMIKELVPWPLGGIAADDFAVQVQSAAEVRQAIYDNLAAGATFVKVAVTELPDHAPRLDAAELAAAVATAHGANRKIVAHVDSADDALLCAAAGVDGLWHDVQLDRLDAAQVQTIAARIHTMVPTLTTFDAFDSLIDGNFHASPLLRATESPGLVQSLLEARAHLGEIPPRLLVWMKRLHENHAGRRANLKALHEAGVTMLVGTDANGADGSFPASIHDELRAMSEAGLTNADVLLGATSRAARFFDATPQYGTIEAGKIADLLLLDGDPLAEIDATARIALVVLRGRVLDRGPGFAK